MSQQKQLHGRASVINYGRFFTITLIILCYAGTARPDETQVSSTADPGAVVQALHEDLEETMRNAETLGMQGRYRKLEPRLMESYDFERMISVAAGSHWRQAGEPERQELLNAFSRFSVATYASRFKGYSGEHFETVNERQGPRQTVLVDTRLIRPAADPVPITYVMRANNGQWQIVDVLLEGTISELAVKRSEYATILGHGGIAELTEVLKEKTAALLSDKSG